MTCRLVFCPGFESVARHLFDLVLKRELPVPIHLSQVEVPSLSSDEMNALRYAAGISKRQIAMYLSLFQMKILKIHQPTQEYGSIRSTEVAYLLFAIICMKRSTQWKLYNVPTLGLAS